MHPDRLGDFLRAYDEYLDGARDYDDLPNFPGASMPRLHGYRERLTHGWNPEDTWGRYAPDAFQSPPPAPPAPPITTTPEVIDLPTKPRRWWWPWGKKEIPTARVVQR